MSGRKQVLVALDQAEYRRINDAEMKMRFNPGELPAVWQTIQHRNQQWLQEERRQSDDRARAYEQYLSGLGGEIRQIEQRTLQNIQRHRDELADAVNTMQNGLLEHSQRILQEQSLFNQELAAQSAQNAALLQNALSHRNEEIGARRAAARSWIRDTYNLGKYIVDSYDFRKFAPGRVEELEQKLWQAQDNLANNLPEAAVVVAQECFREFTALRAQLELETSRFSALRNMAGNVLTELREMGNANRRVPAMDLEGKELEIDLDVDVWSGYRLSRWMEMVEAYQRQVEQNAENLDVPALRNLVQVSAPDLKTKFQNIIFQARMAVIHSQLRINIADIVIRALTMQGFDLAEAHYLDDDQSQAYTARVVNPEGAEVVVQVAPVTGTSLKSKLSLENHDSIERTENELKRRAEEIRKTLNAFGLHTGTVEVLANDLPQMEGTPQPEPEPAEPLPSRPTAVEPIKARLVSEAEPRIERTPFIE